MHDLLAVVQLATDELKRELTLNNQQAQAAVDRFQTAAARVTGAATDIETNTAMFAAAVAKLEAEGAWQMSDVAVLKCRLIPTASLMWLELMEDFFGSDDRRVFLARFEKVSSYAVSKIPILGDVFEAVRTAIEVYTARIKEAEDADAYLASLESYVDAGNMYLNCALTFCESAARTLKGQLPATTEELKLRVAAHIASVGAGNHSTSAEKSDS